MYKSKSKCRFSFLLRILFLLLVVAFSVFPIPVNAEGTFIDTQGHWAEEEIIRMFQKSVVKGYVDGSFRPDMCVSRAEFITMVNRAMGFQKKAAISFSDVNTENWYHDEIARAVKEGYIKGYTDGTMNPNGKISRQEAAVIIFRLLNMEEENEKRPVDKFSDSETVSSWSKEEVNKVVSEGYMIGYPNKTFNPLGEVSRAETVAILSRAVGQLYNEPGSYGPSEGIGTIEDNVTVTVSGVTLRNMVIKGDLFLTAGIGDGEAHIKGVTVEGRTLVTGGGPESIVFEDSTLGVTIVRQDDGTVRVVFTGNTSVSSLVIKSGGIIEITTEDGEVISVEVGTDDDIELIGNFNTVTVEAEDANVNLVDGNIDKLIIGDGAEGSNINISDGASVNTLECNACASVTGEGDIDSAIINIDGISMQQRPANLLLQEGLGVEIAGVMVYESYEYEEDEPSQSTGQSSGSSVRTVSLSVSQAVYNYSETDIGTTDIFELTTNATKVTASSDDEDVAEVIVDGTSIKVTPKGVGTAEITVTGSRSGYRGRTLTITVTVTAYSPEVKSIEISGPVEVTIPESGQPDKTEEYTAAVYDQFDEVMEGVDLAWGIDGSLEGVCIDDGTLTLTEEASEGVIIITALPVAGGEVTGEFEVTLSIEEVEEFAGGDGTEAAPWEIETPQQLDNIRNYLGEENDDKHFVLIENIDLTEFGEGHDSGKGWEPLGSSDIPFTGNFNGGGKTIENLYINRTEEDFIGLFGATKGAAIENLGLVDVNITGVSHVGGLVGRKGSNDGENNGSVIGCYVTGDTVTGQDYVGGLIGQSYDNITDCRSTAQVTGENLYIGGLVGYNNSGTIKNCYAEGDVNGYQSVGGLAGEGRGSILCSYARGTVSGTLYVGGLAGTWGSEDSEDKIEDSYAAGNASGTTYVAGLVATNHGNTNNCYSVGSVTGTAGLAGLLAQNYGEVTNSFWDTELSGQTTSAGGGIGRTTSEMLQEDIFTGAGWDFGAPGVWSIEEGESYPYLQWQGEENIPYPPEAEQAALREIYVLDQVRAGWDIHIAGDYAYTTHITSGLGVIDISDPGAPKQVDAYGPKSFYGLYVQDNRAYVAADNEGIYVFSVYPEDPDLIDSINLDGWNAEDIDVSGNYAYVANTRGGLEVIDTVSQNRVTSVLSSGDYYVNAVTVQDDVYACVATWEHEPGIEQLWTIDISDPGDPKTVAAVELPSRSYKLASAGGYVYAGTMDNGVLVIDISNPLEPDLVGSFDTLTNDVRGIYVEGSYAFVTDVERFFDGAFHQGGLYMLDISDPGNPEEICRIECSDPKGVWVEGDYVYVVDSGKLRVVEISINP